MDYRNICSSVVLVLIGLCSVASAADLKGEGEWQSLSGDSIKGSWTIFLEHSGGIVKGRLELKGSNAFNGGEVSGTMDEDGIVLGLMAEASKHATFQGKLDGISVSGEWQSEAVQDHGVWSGSLEKVTDVQ
jgi:hypothetical protein